MKRLLTVTISLIGLLLVLFSGLRVCRTIKATEALEHTRWGLKYYLINGVQSRELVGEEWVQFDKKSFFGHDGCNRISGEYSVKNKADFNLNIFFHTLLACQVFNETTNQFTRTRDEEFNDALESAVAYEQNADELWLFYPEDKSHALVFGSRPYDYEDGDLKLMEIKPLCKPSDWLCLRLREIQNLFTN